MHDQQCFCKKVFCSQAPQPSQLKECLKAIDFSEALEKHCFSKKMPDLCRMLQRRAPPLAAQQTGRPAGLDLFVWWFFELLEIGLHHHHFTGNNINIIITAVNILHHFPHQLQPLFSSCHWCCRWSRRWQAQARRAGGWAEVRQRDEGQASEGGRDGKVWGGGGKVDGVSREGRKGLPSTSSRLVWQHSWTSWTFLYKSCWVTCQKWHKFDRKYFRRFLSHLRCHHQQLLVLWPQKISGIHIVLPCTNISTTGIFGLFCWL